MATAGCVSGDTSTFGTDNRGVDPNSRQGREQLRRERDRIDNPPQIGQGRPSKKRVNSGENEIQRRIRLAGEARELDPYDFGVTEFLFGR